MSASADADDLRDMVAGRDAAISGSTANTFVPNPELGLCWSLDGMGGFAVTNEDVPLGTGSISVTAWARRASTGAAHTINAYPWFGFRANNRFYFSLTELGDDGDTPQSWTDTEPHLWVGTFDAVTLARKIYRDGVLVLSNTSPPPLGGGILVLGQSAFVEVWHGEIADFRIYDHALSPELVAHLYDPLTRWSLWRDDVRASLGSATASYAKTVRGAARVYNPITGKTARGQYGVSGQTFNKLARGAARGLAAASRQLRGAHTLVAETSKLARGAYLVSTAGWSKTLRGRAIVRNTFSRLARGNSGIVSTRSKTISGRYRVADDALARYELFHGVNAAPNFNAAPESTFTSLPFDAAVIGAGDYNKKHTYVLRRRNAWNLQTQNVMEWVVELDGSGNARAVPPSDPINIAVAPGPAGVVLVSARYLYAADGTPPAQADKFLVYLRSNGTNPDPSVDTPTVVNIIKADGVAKLLFTSSAFSEGADVRVIVRTRRSGAPNVDSIGTTVYSTTATLLGPLPPAPGAAFLGRSAQQNQQSGGVTLCFVTGVTIEASAPTTIDVKWTFGRTVSVVAAVDPAFKVGGLSPTNFLSSGSLQVTYRYALPSGFYTWLLDDTPTKVTSPGNVIPVPQTGTTGFGGGA